MASKNMMNHYRQAARGFELNALKYMILLSRYVRNRTIVELGGGVHVTRFSPPALLL
jgi:hypothetical protein